MKRTNILAASLIWAGAAITGAQAGTSPGGQALQAATAGRQSCTQIEPLSPFTHEVTIPADADVASIRFAGIKLTRVSTELEISEDPEYCKELSEGDPRGSAFCPTVEPVGFMPAYEVTYSYIGSQMASDEHGNKQFTFSVYFRPDELDPTHIQQISNGSRARAAEWFEVSTSRRMTESISVDEAASSFCSGHYLDGNWVHNDPACQDRVKLHEITRPSDYVTVQVSVDRQVRTAGMSSR